MAKESEVDVPVDTDLDALKKAFEAGNYLAVREGVARIEKSDKPDAVKKAARELRAATEPSRAQLYLLAIAAALIGALSIYEIHEHGKNAPPPPSPITPATRTSVEHIR